MAVAKKTDLNENYEKNTAHCLLCSTWLEVTSENPAYQDKWMCDESWFQILKKIKPLSLPSTPKAGHSALNAALSMYFGSDYEDFSDLHSMLGISSCSYFTEDPFTRELRKVQFYYRQVKVEDVPIPPACPANFLVDDFSKSKIV